MPTKLKGYECRIHREAICGQYCVRKSEITNAGDYITCMMYQPPLVVKALADAVVKAVKNAEDVPVEKRTVESPGREEDHSPSDDKGKGAKADSPDPGGNDASVEAGVQIRKEGEDVCPKSSLTPAHSKMTKKKKKPGKKAAKK